MQLPPPPPRPTDWPTDIRRSMHTGRRLVRFTASVSLCVCVAWVCEWVPDGLTDAMREGRIHDSCMCAACE